MASPQTENGFTKLANELLDELCRLHLSGNEWCFVHALIRKTYGYNKKEDWITNSQIATLTGMHRVRVSEAKSKLLEKGIVTEKSNKISLVKDYDKWKSVTEKRNTVTEKRNKVLRKSVPTKERKKGIQKKLSNSDELLKINFKSMAWKEYKEPTYDYNSGEQIKDTQTVEKEENKKITNNLKVLSEIRGLPFADLPTQRKKYREILNLKYTHLQIAEKYGELVESKYWQEQKKNRKQLPDMKSLHSTLKNIIHE